MADVKGMTALMHRMTVLGETRPVMRLLQLATIAEANKRVPRKTGNLQRSIRPGLLTDDHAQVVAHANYAAAVEYGTKAHDIVPRKARVLAWGGGRRLSGRLRSGQKPDHFAARVHHPGTKAHPYLVPGAKAAVQEVGTEAIVKSWNESA